MNKKEFTDILKARYGISTKEAQGVVNMFFGGIIHVLEKKQGVNFIGYGAFSTTEIKERYGVHLQTKQPLKYPASIKVKFKVGKLLKEAAKASIPK